jgi:hypothetical protein
MDIMKRGGSLQSKSISSSSRATAEEAKTLQHKFSDDNSAKSKGIYQDKSQATGPKAAFEKQRPKQSELTSAAKQTPKRPAERREESVTEFVERKIQGMTAVKRAPPVMSARVSDLLLRRLEDPDATNQQQAASQTKLGAQRTTEAKPVPTRSALGGLSTDKMVQFVAPLLQKYAKVKTSKPHKEYFKATVQEFKTRYFAGVRRQFKTPPVNSARIYSLLEFAAPQAKPSEPKYSRKDIDVQLSAPVQEFRSKVFLGLKRNYVAPPVNSARIFSLLEVAATGASKPRQSKVNSSKDFDAPHSTSVEEFRSKVFQGLKKNYVPPPVNSARIYSLLEVAATGASKQRQSKVTSSKDFDAPLSTSVEEFRSKVFQGLKKNYVPPPVNSARIYSLLEAAAPGASRQKSKVTSSKDFDAPLSTSVEEFRSKVFQGLKKNYVPPPVNSARIYSLLEVAATGASKKQNKVNSSKDFDAPLSTSVEEFRSKIFQGLKKNYVLPPVNSARIYSLLEVAAPGASRQKNKVTSSKDFDAPLSTLSTSVEEFRSKIFQGLKKNYVPPPVNSARIYSLLEVAATGASKQRQSKVTSSKDFDAPLSTSVEEFRSKAFQGLKKNYVPPPVNSGRIFSLLDRASDIKSASSLTTNKSANMPNSPDLSVLSYEKRLIEGLKAKAIKPKLNSISTGLLDRLLLAANLQPCTPVVTAAIDDDLMLTMSFSRKIKLGLKPTVSKVPVKSSRIVHLLMRQGRVARSCKSLQDTEDTAMPESRKLITGLVSKSKTPVMSSRITSLLRVKEQPAPEQPRMVNGCRVIAGISAKSVKPASSVRYMLTAKRQGLIGRRTQKALSEAEDLTRALRSIVESRRRNASRALSQRLVLEKIREVETKTFALKQVQGLVFKQISTPISGWLCRA